MNLTVTLTRPDGTPITEEEFPAPGTLLVLQVDEARDPAQIGLMTTLPSLRARVLGWIPRAGASDRRLLLASCRTANRERTP